MSYVKHETSLWALLGKGSLFGNNLCDGGLATSLLANADFNLELVIYGAYLYQRMYFCKQASVLKNLELTSDSEQIIYHYRIRIVQAPLAVLTPKRFVREIARAGSLSGKNF